ncbi:hypothetical protein K461DRAFT_324482 [Myriangium duriaei CBS 260.36]|uniref:ubiquitinyl hydrolase 1 n=1 Tax=Myriangium duriaei CBS 260.36 TaxID=1168546 RepID=A0A9P4IWM0_9PEZI|nr:hypothetical protein K461DRAFT_324482 [Myriangium duriaei CBS 260.36]
MDHLPAIVHHLVLPPNIPSAEDADLDAIAHGICSRLSQACKHMSRQADGPVLHALRSLLASLKNSSSIHEQRLEKQALIDLFGQLEDGKVLILHVAEQNAALNIHLVDPEYEDLHDTASNLLRNDNEAKVRIEAFEASPPSEEVLEAQDRLAWAFPGRAVELPQHVFNDSSFRGCLASFLEQASMESLQQFQSVAQKAGAAIPEIRGVADPSLITQMLMSLLEGIGSAAPIHLLEKHIRDDVNFHHASRPWRRHPFWLVLRISTQRHLQRLLGKNLGRFCYKLLLCMLLADLLHDSVGKLTPELAFFLLQKLGRRLTKIEVELHGDNLIGDDRVHAISLIDAISPAIETVITAAKQQIEAVWTRFKLQNHRPVRDFPKRATSFDTRLELHNSLSHLEAALSSNPKKHLPCRQLAHTFTINSRDASETQQFIDHYRKLFQAEQALHSSLSAIQSSAQPDSLRCEHLAESLLKLLSVVQDHFAGFPELVSPLLLLVFETWARMDEYAVSVCPLLATFASPFPPSLLDILHLPQMRDMKRLQSLQIYMDKRRKSRQKGSVFSTKFAADYVDQSESLMELRNDITHAATQARSKKMKLWNGVQRQYVELSQRIEASACVCTVDAVGNIDATGCNKHYHYRCRKRLGINVFEDWLPPAEDSARTATILLELHMPRFLGLYRDVTWKLMCDLCHPSITAEPEHPVLHLTGYSQLKSYMRNPGYRVTLASKTKSFLKTHYRLAHGNVTEQHIFLPMGPTFEYFDNERNCWIKHIRTPLTLHHLCGVWVPTGLYPVLLQTPTGSDSPTSYQIQANRSTCPRQLSVHEFSAFQKLLSGGYRRWLNILMELGSANLNFSKEDTMLMISQLAVQAGPDHEDHSPSALRVCHNIFEDEQFVQRLVQQIDNRLEGVRTNWAELYCMELLICLSLRVSELRHEVIARRLVEKARTIVFNWMEHFLHDLNEAPDSTSWQKCAQNVSWTAMLCRATFAVHSEQDGLFEDLAEEDLSLFVRASVAFQNNLPAKKEGMPSAFRRLLINDTNLGQSIQPVLYHTVSCHPEQLSLALSEATLGSTARITSWDLRQDVSENWISSRGAEELQSDQIDYNYVTGMLLINGQPRGQLPPEFFDSEDVRELFGDRPIQAYTTNKYGMTHQLTAPIQGNHVYLKVQASRVVIRAETRFALFELIPRRFFLSNDSFDLPAELTLNCVHWLNLDTGELEVRRKPAIWYSRNRDWKILVAGRRAIRGNVELVCPSSELFRQASTLFQNFEHPFRITVYQSRQSHRGLFVHLRELELSFVVNGKGLLECELLGAEIDPDQDVGTWYGFQSKLVIRDLITEKRSVLIPLGSPVWTRHGVHVSVTVGQKSGYGKYDVDPVLGRLTCAPEPRLLYTKAPVHALISFVLPDPLTGLTGTEEALSILKSGAAQPWTELTGASLPTLQTLRSLAPKQEYYPPEKRVLQTITWDLNATVTMQHDAFDRAVRHILRKSDGLKALIDCANELPSESPSTILRLRSETRRLKHDRRIPAVSPLLSEDCVYSPRDRVMRSNPSNLAFEIAEAVCRNPNFRIRPSGSIHSLLESWPVVGGPGGNYTLLTSSLTSLLNCAISEQWGTLVSMASESESRYQLAFRLCILAFNHEANEAIIRFLSAYGVVDELKALSMPDYPSFSECKFNTCPPEDGLMELISESSLPYMVDPAESKKRNAEKRKRHHQDCRAEARRIAGLLLQQWPSEDLVTTGISSDLINLDRMLGEVRLVWYRILHNKELRKYLDSVQRILCSYEMDGGERVLAPSYFPYSHGDFHCTMTTIPPKGSRNDFWDEMRDDAPLGSSEDSRHIPSLEELATQADIKCSSMASMDWAAEQIKLHPTIRGKMNPSKDRNTLRNILQKLRESSSHIRRAYGEDLTASLAALEKLPATCGNFSSPPSATGLVQQNRLVEDVARQQLDHIIKAVRGNDRRYRWLSLANLWPPTTRRTLLMLLNRRSRSQIQDSLKQSLITFGITMTQIQRLSRLRNACAKHDVLDIESEILNPGHETWNPRECHDWLLMELDGDILIRPEQIDVARAIINPVSGKNSLLQLNMGKGKTSCIIPMAMAFLSDRSRLGRLVVPRALVLQTAQVIQMRLGGLADREITHLPFNRRTPCTDSILGFYEFALDRANSSFGLLLSTPEDIMSLKLVGWQLLQDDKPREAQRLLDVQKWISKNCRDVIDESDHALSVKTQLIYPSGDQDLVDGGAIRWEAAQEVLHLAACHIDKVKQLFPRSVLIFDLKTGPAQGQVYPIIQFLDSEPEERLLEAIVEDIAKGRTSILRFSIQVEPFHHRLISEVLTSPVLDRKAFERAVKICSVQETAPSILLTLRGLLRNRILLVCLKKRWNVQYGLDLSRCPVAVPFEAKGVPSERAEYGHPDVVITLTCLSFYFSGLTLDQFRDGLQRVLQADDSAADSERWTGPSASLQDSMSQWFLINIEDSDQIQQLWKDLRFSRTVINHFLNSFVFPVHAKQFAVKMSASAWDIPHAPEHLYAGQLMPVSGGQIAPVAGRQVAQLAVGQMAMTADGHAVSLAGGQTTTLAGAQIVSIPGGKTASDTGGQTTSVRAGQTGSVGGRQISPVVGEQIVPVAGGQTTGVASGQMTLVTGWQTPSVTVARTTGFSGTNDSKIMLPLTIEQNDLIGLLHTNAEVLSTLLEDRNRKYELAADHFGARQSEKEMLRNLHHKNIRILIDAGAYVLEMDNRTLASTWLEIHTEASAAVYFGPDHRAWVKYRGKEQDVPLLATPYAQDLGDCLVYLDEQHTRGVDLRFPANARGALTLAVGQSKDHTVQGMANPSSPPFNSSLSPSSLAHNPPTIFLCTCPVAFMCFPAMRLRQLATTQSVVFVAPPDVHQSLLDVCGLSSVASVDSSHVVHWLLEQTCRGNEELLGLYFAQGIDFYRRTDLQRQYLDASSTVRERRTILKKLRTPEFQTLEQMYGQPVAITKPNIARSTALGQQLEEIYQRKKLVAQEGSISLMSAFEEVEQERELEFQVEEVRELQIPTPREALRFNNLHPQLREFLRTGIGAPDSHFMSVFHLLSNTQTGKKHAIKPLASRLFVSAEFQRTVRIRGNGDEVGDDYVRPVEWIVWSTMTETAIIVIPEEAEHLLSMMVAGQRASGVHMIPYAAPVTRAMRRYSSLRYFALPSLDPEYRFPTWLPIEVGILAGRMVFEAEELEPLKRYLVTTPTGKSRLIGFLFEWTALRRQARDIDHTPLGYVCLDRQLTAESAFFK